MRFPWLALLVPATVFSMRPSSKQLPFGQEPFRTSRHNGLATSVFTTRASSSYESMDGRETLTHPWGWYNLKDLIASYKIVYEAAHGAGTYVNPLQTAKGSSVWNDKDIYYSVDLDARTSGVVFSFYHLFEGVGKTAATALFGSIEKRPAGPSAAQEFLDGLQVYVGADLPLLGGTAAASYRMDPSLSHDFMTTLSKNDIALIDDVRRKLQHDDLGLHSNAWSANGVGDLDIYLGFGRAFDHQLRIRMIDLSCVVGMTVPTGGKRELNSPLSIPFGFDDVTYHADFLAELELKQGWRAGCTVGLNSGCTTNIERRVPVMNEPADIAPLIFSPEVKTGMTFACSPYFTLENMQPGLHVTLRYRYVNHFEDEWRDLRENPAIASFLTRSTGSGFDQVAALNKFNKNTAWTSKHLSLTATYDPGQREGKWSKKPLFWFSYDYPLDGGLHATVLRNRRAALGLTLRF